MAVTIYGTEADEFLDPELPLRDVTVGPTEETRVWPYPILGGVRALYLQKCWDSSTGLWNFWHTYYQDIYGNEYPGTTFDFATYRIVAITHTREQS
jgi:hypothetical protein